LQSAVNSTTAQITSVLRKNPVCILFSQITRNQKTAIKDSNNICPSACRSAFYA